jgi:hypothetical protein
MFALSTMICAVDDASPPPPPPLLLLLQVSGTKKVSRYHPPAVREGLVQLEVAKERLAATAVEAYSRFLGEFAQHYPACKVRCLLGGREIPVTVLVQGNVMLEWQLLAHVRFSTSNVITSTAMVAPAAGLLGQA